MEYLDSRSFRLALFSHLRFFCSSFEGGSALPAARGTSERRLGRGGSLNRRGELGISVDGTVGSSACLHLHFLDRVVGEGGDEGLGGLPKFRRSSARRRSSSWTSIKR
jgi:hypothetical protein